MVPYYRDYINRWRRALSGGSTRRVARAVPRAAADGADAV